MIAMLSDFVLVLVGAAAGLLAVCSVGGTLLRNKRNRRGYGSFYDEPSHRRLMQELAGHD